LNQVESSRLELGAIDAHTRTCAMGWRNDERVYKWCRQFEPITLEHHNAYWERVKDDPTTRMYSIRYEGWPVGVCGFTSIDWVNRRAEFSLYIAPDKQGKGLGERALRALCDHGFNVLNLNMIWGEAFEGNPAIQMFKRVGFKEEGVRREFYFRDGEFVNAILFSLLRREYV
jgi:RimJ/RimL family protein N-acetyltransferase